MNELTTEEQTIIVCALVEIYMRSHSLTLPIVRTIAVKLGVEDELNDVLKNVGDLVRTKRN